MRAERQAPDGEGEIVAPFALQLRQEAVTQADRADLAVIGNEDLRRRLVAAPTHGFGNRLAIEGERAHLNDRYGGERFGPTEAAFNLAVAVHLFQQNFKLNTLVAGDVEGAGDLAAACVGIFF